VIDANLTPRLCVWGEFSPSPRFRGREGEGLRQAPPYSPRSGQGSIANQRVPSERRRLVSNVLPRVAVEMWRQCMPPEYRSWCDFLEGAPPQGGRLLDVPAAKPHALEPAAAATPDGDGPLDRGDRGGTRCGVGPQVELELVEGDMRAAVAGAVRRGYCWGNAFGYLEDGGDAAFLKAAAKCLKPGPGSPADGHRGRGGSAEPQGPHLVSHR
jgi:hypothetical protein